MFILQKTHHDRQTFADMASDLDLFSSVLTFFYLITFPRNGVFPPYYFVLINVFDVSSCPLINVIPEEGETLDKIMIMKCCQTCCFFCFLILT